MNLGQNTTQWHDVTFGPICALSPRSNGSTRTSLGKSTPDFVRNYQKNQVHKTVNKQPSKHVQPAQINRQSHIQLKKKSLCTQKSTMPEKSREYLRKNERALFEAVVGKYHSKGNSQVKKAVDNFNAILNGCQPSGNKINQRQDIVVGLNAVRAALRAVNDQRPLFK